MRLRSKLLLGVATFALAGTLYVHGYETLRVAAILHRLSFPITRESSALADFRAIFRSPAPLSYHTLLIYSQYLRSLSSKFDAIRADSSRSAELDETFTQSFRIVERESGRDPRNERIAVHKARIAMLAAQYYREPRFFGVALETLRAAVEMSPRRIQTRHILSSAYLVAGQPAAAIAQLDTALRIFPSYAATHVHLATAFRSVGDYSAAERWLHGALDLGAKDPPKLFLDVATGLLRSGNRPAAAGVLRHYLEVKYGPLWLWPPKLFSEMPASDQRALGLAAIIERESGVRGRTSSETLDAAISRQCRTAGVSPFRTDRDACGRGVSLLSRDSITSLFMGPNGG